LLFNQYTKICRKLLDVASDDPEVKNILAISYSKLGETHTALGNLEQALTYFDDETKLSEELFEAYPQNVSFNPDFPLGKSSNGSH